VIMSVQCAGFTVKKTQCRNRVVMGTFCYLHQSKVTPPPQPPPKDEIVNFQQVLVREVKPLSPADFLKFIQPQMIPSGLPPRDVTFDDVCVFERVVEYLPTYRDIVNLCMASRHFLNRMREDTFLHSITKAFRNVHDIDLEKISPYFIMNAFGIRDENQPSLISLFRILGTPDKFESFLTRSERTVKLLIHGKRLFDLGVYHTQPIKSRIGSGYFCGISENGEFWFHLDRDALGENGEVKLISKWKDSKSKQDCEKINIEFL
jgi:hypothetical protein